jgi:hypothetical protein
MKPKAFQEATVKAALKALTNGSRRFLVADEVGLGKTVVAREIIQRLAKPSGARPYRVFYFGSGRTVTAQNAPRLQPLEDSGLSSERCDASRPSLIPMERRVPSEKVQIFQFTPETAIPVVRGHGRGGVALERALLRVLLAKALHYRLPPGKGGREALCGAATKERFASAVRLARKKHRNGDLLHGHGFVEQFRAAVRDVFAPDAINSLDDRLNTQLGKDPRLFVGRLRLALAKATLSCLPPDLVIFDEFHRYRDRVFCVPGESPGEEFLSLLPSESRPAILLLSATPFRQSQKKVRSSASVADADNFHRLVGFLHGDGAAASKAYERCKAHFAKFEGVLAAKRFDATEVRRVRDRLQESVLRPRIARMERAAFSRMSNEAGALRSPERLPEPKDLDSFVRFAAGLDDKDKPAAIAFWRSIPYPHQFLGKEYVARRRANPSKWRHLAGMTPEKRASLRFRGAVPNARFRELLRIFPPEVLALPWLAPSRPWWPMRGPWKRKSGERSLEKGLLFSLFRATPRAIAGLLSFAVEDWASRQRGWRNFTKLGKQSFLAPKSVSAVALFHPFQWLAEVVDPLASGDRSKEALLADATRTLRQILPQSVAHLPQSRRRRPAWQVLAMLEHERQAAMPLADLWRSALRNQGMTGQAGRALKRMAAKGASAERSVSQAELEEIAWFALSAPGVVLLRALRRHWPQAAEQENLPDIVDLAWNGLRPYLDRPWFVARLMKGKRVSGYPKAIQDAVLEGNLEAVLDEHFWLPDPEHAAWEKSGRKDGRIAALRDTLGIRSAPVVISEKKRRITLSAHAAMPLTDTEAHTAATQDVKQLRADDLRRAFNTPFWPHVLCTTSVGQEGLDFHLWCRTIVHWDLCSTPVDLEQREGRVDRFKSLAVRRAMSKGLGTGRAGNVQTWNAVDGQSKRFEDDTGLAPWWVFRDATIDRWFMDPPASEERRRRQELKHLRELYRLALGLPHHHDVVKRLAATKLNLKTIRSCCLDLGATRRPRC